MATHTTGNSKTTTISMPKEFRDRIHARMSQRNLTPHKSNFSRYIRYCVELEMKCPQEGESKEKIDTANALWKQGFQQGFKDGFRLGTETPQS
jgi:hypothetical protein